MRHAQPISADSDEPEAAVEQEDEASDSLLEGQIYDYVTNEPVRDTPVEQILQAVARSLVDEYGFDHTQLQRDVRITLETYTSTGKTKRTRRKLDIVVYPENAPKDDADKIIRVCIVQSPSTKATDNKRGVPLLEEVLGALPDCEYGLWTNGTDLAFRWKRMEKRWLEPQFEDLYDLPGYGETAANLDDPTRPVGRIATGDNLKRTFARVHDYIYGNQGLKKDAAFWQVLNLIFCKIHDEHTHGKRRFWVRGTERNTPEGQAKIAGRIKELFAEVKAHTSYASVFSERDTIDLNERVLAYVVGELSRYTLKDTDVDVKGAAYEEITSSMLKSQRGQFFTPTNVIRLMVTMLDPGSDAEGNAVDMTDPATWPKILDPACGSGRFLTYALDHIRRKVAAQLFPQEHALLQVRRLENDEAGTQLVRDFAGRCLFGIDFDPDLKRVARMNMILNNDGHGNILSLNSLEFPLMLGGRPPAHLRREVANQDRLLWPDPVRARLDADLDTFDFVFTNPPFGSKIPVDEPEILQQFDLAHRWSQGDDGRWTMGGDVQRSVAPEVLFVERCVQWVKPGTGKVAIVLPDGILGNPDAEYIRYWILQHCQVLASVDLPVEAFLPQVGVQASLLFLRRKSQAEMDAEALGRAQDYSVFMAVAETVGHDRRGNTLYVRDADGAEMIFYDAVPHIRRRGRRDRVVTETEARKHVDDDLPRVAEAYASYKTTGEVAA
ncbi:MAG: N-6 DNA methylase [Anaerolineae bacterium]|nr:N-6 DNA methylase [Anaerolineae bacterium]